MFSTQFPAKQRRPVFAAFLRPGGGILPATYGHEHELCTTLYEVLNYSAVRIRISNMNLWDLPASVQSLTLAPVPCTFQIQDNLFRPSLWESSIELSPLTSAVLSGRRIFFHVVCNNAGDKASSAAQIRLYLDALPCTFDSTSLRSLTLRVSSLCPRMCRSLDFSMWE